MKVKKLFMLVVLLLSSVTFIACNDVTTTEGTTTAAQTTAEETTTAAQTTTEATTQTTTAAPVDLVALMDQLKTQYADTLEDETYKVTEDIPLVTTVGDITVTYSSNNTTYLENDGTVHRPAYSDGDQTVVLTATLSHGDDTETYMFFVTIQALDKTDQERADEVFVVVTAFPNKELWTSADNDDLDFLTTGQDLDGVSYTVVWTSSDPAVISTDGTITQPLGANQTVTMTATVTINSVEYSTTVDFTVAKMIEGTAYNTIAEAYTAYKAGNTDEDFNYFEYVKLVGVTVVGISDAGIYITDGTDILYVYSPSFTVEVGSVYDITGQLILYYNAWELTGEDSYPMRAEASTAAVSPKPVTTAANIGEVITAMTTPTYANPFEGDAYRVTARVYYEESWGNYSVFLVPADYDFDAPLGSGATQPNGDSIMIYYPSDDETLRSFHGELVTIDIIMQGYRTDKLVWYAVFFGDASDVELAFESDADAVAAAANALTFPNQVIEDTTFDLFTSLYGTTISYVSDNAIIDATTGVVDLTGVTTQTTVTLTATVTLNAETTDVVFTIDVGPLPMSDVADAYTAPAGDLIKVTGVLTTDIKPYQYFLQDLTAGISLDVYSLQTEFGAIALGSEVVITGKIEVSNGLYELVVMDYEVLTTTPALPTPADLDGVTFDDTTLMDYQGQMVSFTGFVLNGEPEADSYGTYTFDLKNYTTDEEISVRIDNRSSGYADAITELLTFTVGDEFVVTGAILGWYWGYQLLIANADQFEVGTNGLNDQQMLDIELAGLPEMLELSEDFEIPESSLGATYTLLDIFGNAANYIDGTTTPGTLLVTQPAGMNAYGTLHIQIDKGTATATALIDVVVEATVLPIVTELFISEYAEGSSNNKYLEIYNGTGSDVDLTGYSVVMYSNGATVASATLDLTGTLVDGDVYIITNDSADASIQAVADSILSYPSPAHFNGDDCVALLKDGEIIDIILEVGHTNDDYVANELTWVRKSDVYGPNPVWDVTEWDEFVADTWTDLDSHTVATATLTQEQMLGADKASLDFGGVVTSAMDITLPTTGTFGSTIVWSITEDLGTNAALNADVLSLGLVFADATVTIEAVITSPDTSLTSTSTFTYLLVGMSGADRVAADKADLEALMLGGELFEDDTVTLPLVGDNGSTIAWAITADAGSNATLVGDTLTLTIPSGEATVEVTATLTSDTASDTVVVTYTLKNYPMVDLGDFPTQTLGDTVVVTGVVYAIIDNGFFIEDATGTLFIYKSGSTYVVGDEVQLTGTVAQYHDLWQLSGVSELPAPLTTGNTITQVAEVYEDGVTTLELGQIYTVIGTLAIEGTYDNVFIYYNDTDAFEIYYNSPDASIAALEAMVGEYVAIDIIYYNDGDTFAFVGGASDIYEVITDFSVFTTMTDMVNYDIPDDQMVYVQGIVTGNSYDGLFLQDAAGLGLFMYRPDETGINVGDEVIFFGEAASYNGARQLGYGADQVAVLSTGNPLVYNMMTADELLAADITDAGKLVKITGLVVNSYSGSNMLFDVVGTTTGQISYRYYSPDWLQDVYAATDTLPEVTFLIYNFRDSITQIDLLGIELTEQQAYDLDIAEIPDPLELTEDMVVEDGEYGTSFTITGITGDAAAFLDYTTTPGTLLVTQPLDADKTGVITATATNGSVTNTITINVTVLMVAAPATPQLFISEYVENGNDKALELYNPTDSAIDLSLYELRYYANGASSPTATISLTGTLAAGEVFVIAYSSAVQAILDVADMTSGSLQFNGNDPVELALVGGAVIDRLGTPGDSSTYADDVSLVRNPSIVSGSLTFDLSEWSDNGDGVYTGLGSHTVS